jgi:hypothetical protein
MLSGTILGRPGVPQYGEIIIYGTLKTVQNDLVEQRENRLNL